jgi:hypothetical protein
MSRTLETDRPRLLLLLLLLLPQLKGGVAGCQGSRNHHLPPAARARVTGSRRQQGEHLDGIFAQAPREQVFIQL